jgi:hypothetical protein
MIVTPGFVYETPNVALAARTLLLAGYAIENSRRQPTHIEILCHTTSVLASDVRYLVAITEADSFSEHTVQELRRIAEREGRSLVLVGATATELQLGWADFMDALGGAVPSWRALAPEYENNLLTTASNRLPVGVTGEAWRLFEDLVADGFELVFGRKVRRMGARKRGQRVSDMITQIPDGAVLVVDAKATAGAFSAAISELRPLVEYTRMQRLRQRGHNEVFAAVLVAPAFVQDASGLSGVSKQFLAETGVPAAFLRATLLGQMVMSFSQRPDLRVAIHWRSLFSGGLIETRDFQSELSRADAERY